MAAKGTFSMVIVDKSIVVVGRKYRSKWWSVSCTCPASRRSKDGSCAHERKVLDQLVPEVRAMARIDVR